MNNYMYGVYQSNYLKHYRTKGSKNGISTTKGYTAIGQKAKYEYKQPYGYKPTGYDAGYVHYESEKTKARKAAQKKAWEEAQKQPTGLKGDPRYSESGTKRISAAKALSTRKAEKRVEAETAARVNNSRKWSQAYRKYVKAPEQDAYSKKLQDKNNERYIKYHTNAPEMTSAMKNDPRYSANSVRMDTKSNGTMNLIFGKNKPTTDITRKTLTNTQEIAAKTAAKKKWHNIFTDGIGSIKRKIHGAINRKKKQVAKGKSLVEKLKLLFK